MIVVFYGLGITSWQDGLAETRGKERFVVCPACQQDSTSATVCSHCGASLANSGVGSTRGDPFPTEPENRRPGVLKSFFLAIAISAAWILVFYLAYFRTVRWSHGVFNAETSGYLIGSLLTPILIAAVIVWAIDRGRKAKLSSARKNLLTAALALGVSLVSITGSLRESRGSEDVSLKQKMGHLMKQAAGKEAAAPDTNWYDGPSREFFRDILNFNQEYTGAMQSAKGSSATKLYTPESYATRAGMEATVTQLHAMLDVDKKYESTEPLIQKLEARISATSASEADKEAFMNGVRNSFGKSLAPRNETMRIEEEWLQSSIDLYGYTLSHSGDYWVRGKKLVFRAGVSPDEFQGLQAKAIALRKDAVESKHKLDAARQAAMSQTGITPADIDSPTSKQK
jgi:hypothetical protein